MYYSDLVKGEKLVHPIEPDIIQRPDSIYVSVRPSVASVPTTTTNTTTTTTSPQAQVVLVEEQLRQVLTVDRVGIVFRVWHECGERGQWLWAQSYATNEFGLLPIECVKRVVSFTY